MFPRYCRVPDYCYDNLGLNYSNNDLSFYKPHEFRHVVTMNEIALGKFKSILKLIYSSNDGSLDNNISKLVSENAPQCVRDFVNNFLLREVPSLSPAPDDDVAFSTILSRHVGTLSELQDYVDTISDYVSNLSFE